MTQQLRVENNQLRQLNKFLEERVAGYERSRAQSLYQQAMLLQQRQEQEAAAAAAAGLPSAALAFARELALPGGGTPAAAAAPDLAVASSNAAAVAAPPAAAGAAATGMVVPPGMMLVPVPQPAAAAAAMPLLPAAGLDASAQLLAMKQQATQAAALGAPMPLPVGAPPVGWLPPPDFTRDQQLRPPAA